MLGFRAAVLSGGSRDVVRRSTAQLAKHLLPGPHWGEVGDSHEVGADERWMPNRPWTRPMCTYSRVLFSAFNYQMLFRLETNEYNKMLITNLSLSMDLGL